eukprot:UN03006
MPRLLHTMLRVGNLEKSIEFYTNALGMKLLRQKEYPNGKFTLAFIGYGNESDTTVLELTYNWGVDKYDLGSAYGHIAIEVDSVPETCKMIEEKYGEATVCRKPGPLLGDPNGVMLAFIVDPDGYKIELLERKDYLDKFEITE